jgi:glycosyltransferase involved in cell wall biosynthesis
MYYAASDIFVFASRTETQGVSIAEALAAGLPCVVVGAMGAAEAVSEGEDGFIVPPGEEPFRCAVERLVHDSALRLSMAEAARRKAPQLSREHCVDELLQLYCSLLLAERVGEEAKSDFTFS